MRPDGAAVAIRIVRDAHGRIGRMVVEQAGRPLDEQIGVGADQRDRPGLHRLRPLGRVAHDQHRLAERRALLPARRPNR